MIKQFLPLDYLFPLLVALAGMPVSAAAQNHLGSVAIGKEATVTVTVPIPTAATLSSIEVLTQGAPNLDFTAAGGGTCAVGTAYAAKSSCTVEVNFKPRYPGTRYGAVVLAGQKGVIATGYLQGKGIGPQSSFLPATPSPVAGGFTAGGMNVLENLAVDAAGNLYVTELGTVFEGGSVRSAVVKETLQPDGTYVQTPIGSGWIAPRWLAVDGAGNVYVTDDGSDPASAGSPAVVVKEALRPDGKYTRSIVGGGWKMPLGIAVDGGGNVYVADSLDDALYKEKLRADGSYAQSTIGSGWTEPMGVAVDGSGNVYVLEQQGYGLFKETLQPDGRYTASEIGTGLTSPQSLAVDGSGNVYISELGTYNGAGSTPPFVYKETLRPDGSYAQTAIGDDWITVQGSEVDWVQGISVDGSGNVYISAPRCAVVIKEEVAEPPELSFAATQVGLVSSAQMVTMENTGNAALRFPIPETGDNPSIPANFTFDSSAESACPLVSASSPAPATLAAGASCVLPIRFEPAEVGVLRGFLVVTDDSLHAASPGYAAHAVPLSGAGTPGLPKRQTITFAPLASPVTFGITPMALSASASSGLPITFAVRGPAAFSGNVLKITGVGVVVVTAYQNGDNEYTAATPVSQTITVNKAILKVAAENVSRLYGAPNPTFGYTFSGFVNGDTPASAVTGAPSLTTTATATSAFGAYPIAVTAGTLAAANYTFAFTNGTLTVEPIGTVAKPVFTPAAKTYTSPQSVTITDATPQAAIYYTLDGTPPSTASKLYSAPVEIWKTETIRAIAVRQGYTPSPVATGAYTLASPPPFTAIRAMGDSISACCEPSTPANLYINRLGAALDLPVDILAIPGDMGCDVPKSQIFNRGELPNYGSTILYTLLISTNDANLKGPGPYEAVFKLCHLAAISWLATPKSNKTTGASFTTIPARWKRDTTYPIEGLASTFNGASAAWPVATSHNGQAIYLWYRIIDGNGGQFSYSVDGGSATVVTNSTSPPMNTLNGATDSVGVVRIAGVAAGAHRVTTKVTSATGAGNIVSVLAVGAAPAKPGALRVWVGGTPYQRSDYKSASTAAFNADVIADVNLLAGDGLGVEFVDVRKYLLGTPAEMYNRVHPNDLGHFHLFEAFQAAIDPFL